MERVCAQRIAVSSPWRANRSWRILPLCWPGAMETVNCVRLLKLLPYAAAIGVFTVALAVAAFFAFERQILELWSWALGFAEANWRRAVFGSGGRIVLFTTGLLIFELFLLSWEKTTVFRVFFQRSKSSITDLAFTIIYFTRFKLLAEYVFTFGWAYLAAKLVDDATARIGWYRLELPTEGVLGVTAGFAVFYLITSFIGYWHHRVFHTTWLWKLHRFHHAATDLNIFTGFRDNPAASFSTCRLPCNPC